MSFASCKSSHLLLLQPFPLQTNSLLGGAVLPSNPVSVGAVGIGTAPRHINIHIHAGEDVGVYMVCYFHAMQCAFS